LHIHVHLVGDGDPASGKKAYWLTMLSRGPTLFEYTPDELTRRVLRRADATGSLMDDEPSSRAHELRLFCEDSD